jgi:magnesium and cobalt transporter
MAEGRRSGVLARITRALAGGLQDRVATELLARQRRGTRRRRAGMLEGAQVADSRCATSRCRARRWSVSAAMIRWRVLLQVASGHSRFPVVDGDKDTSSASCWLAWARDAGPPTAKFDMRERLRRQCSCRSQRLNVRCVSSARATTAIVVDEYDGVAGLVTIEDVIEQIVGDIADEYDVEEDQGIRRDGDRQFTVRGTTRIDEFNEYFGTELGDEEFDTIAGLVMQQFGRVPRRGESVQLAGMEFRVLRTDRRRIDSLRVTLAPTAPEPQGAAAD